MLYLYYSFLNFKKNRPLGQYHYIVDYGDKKGIIQNDETFNGVQISKKENNWNSQLQNHSVMEYFNSKL